MATVTSFTNGAYLHVYDGGEVKRLLVSRFLARQPAPDPIVSDDTIDLSGVDGKVVHVTGTNPTDTIIGLTEGKEMWLVADDDGWTLNYDATDLPIVGGKSLTLKTGDEVLAVGGSGSAASIKDIKPALNEDARAALGIVTDVTAKVYRAVITQTGTADPVATVFENSIGAIVWTRTGVGQYVATLANAFPAGKTFMHWGFSSVDAAALSGSAAFMDFTRTSDDTILHSYGAAGDLQDWDYGVANVSLSIWVYP